MSTINEYNQWNTASKSLAETIICALEGIQLYNYRMIIKYLPNSEHHDPARVINGGLNNPFNWKCTSQFHRTKEEFKKDLDRCVNDTERDLMQNWTCIFGEPDAIKLYEETGKCTSGLFKGIGTCSQVRIKDLIDYLNDSGEYDRAKLWSEPRYFTGSWSPKNIAMYEPADGNSYAVYYNKNLDQLPVSELNKLLDESIKEVVSVS